ncbi:MAG: coenzyme F420-0:L-glutamate ligase [Patescibacteria group bacterium]
MIIKPVKTRIIVPPKDDLLEAIGGSIKFLKEKSIVAITSKVVSIWQGRCILADCSKNKDDLIIKEADFYISRKLAPGQWCMQTLKNNLLIPSAGIDESNAKGHYILWPDNLKHTVKKLYNWFKKKYRVKNLGIIITDSHTIPLRRGVMGISLAHYGFMPLKDYRKKKDLFGRPFKVSQTNIADSLASSAVLLMGEGSECTPMAIIEDVPFIKFSPKPFSPKTKFSSFEIKTKEDLYYSLISAVKWKKGGSS